MAWTDWVFGLGLVVVLVLSVVAIILITAFEDSIDTDDATVTVTASEPLAALTPSSLKLQFVTADNGVIMTLTGFEGTLSGANSPLITSPIPEDFRPSVFLVFPIIVKNNVTHAVGLMTIDTAGVIRLFAGPGGEFFLLGSVKIQNIGVSWTQNLL